MGTLPYWVYGLAVFGALAVAGDVIVELLVLALATAISAYIALDGESHWLEGALLLALYLMTAGVFFLDPSTA